MCERRCVSLLIVNVFTSHEDDTDQWSFSCILLLFIVLEITEKVSQVVRDTISTREGTVSEYPASQSIYVTSISQFAFSKSHSTSMCTIGEKHFLGKTHLSHYYLTIPTHCVTYATSFKMGRYF